MDKMEQYRNNENLLKLTQNGNKLFASRFKLLKLIRISNAFFGLHLYKLMIKYACVAVSNGHDKCVGMAGNDLFAFLLSVPYGELYKDKISRIDIEMLEG